MYIEQLPCKREFEQAFYRSGIFLSHRTNIIEELMPTMENHSRDLMFSWSTNSFQREGMLVHPLSCILFNWAVLVKIYNLHSEVNGTHHLNIAKHQSFSNVLSRAAIMTCCISSSISSVLLQTLDVIFSMCQTTLDTPTCSTNSWDYSTCAKYRVKWPLNVFMLCIRLK